MNADKLFESTPNTPEFYLPKLSNQAQKFGILMKKGFIGHPWSVSLVKGSGILWLESYPASLFAIHSGRDVHGGGFS